MMRKYHMVLHSPMGPRDGTLALEEDRGTVTGTLNILSHELPIRGSRQADGCLRLAHQIITAVGEYPCCSVLWDTDGILSGELQMDQSETRWGCSKYQKNTVMPWSGERLEEMEATHK